MFGTYFYHSHIRDITAVFGTLFNNISTVAKKQDGTVVKQEKVPLAYGPREKFLARIDGNPNLRDAKLAVKLPRMAFEMSGMNFAPERNTNAFCNVRLPATDGDDNRAAKLLSGAPYDLNFTLEIMSRTQNDALQIVEQILPHFKPSYSVEINPIDSQTSVKQSVKFTLNSCSPNHQSTGPFEERPVLIYTLEFTATMLFFGEIENGEVIKEATANMYDFDNQTNLIKGKTYSVNPSTATENETHTIDVTETFGFD